MLWKELKKQWRFMDGIVILILIVISFAPMVIFSMSQKDTKDGNQTMAIVSINGKEVDRYELTDQTPHKEKTYYPGKGQYNIIEMEGNKIRVKEDNSPDQIAVRTGWISKPGQTSICLPHKLVIEIKSQVPSEDEEMIITY
ncbi:MAG: NusG domain II-containing protein [Vagococcus sp.]